jgi:hypothetical protein
VALRLTRPLLDPVLIVTRDLHAPDGLEVGFELWRVPFAGWGEPHDLRARGRCVPRRYTVVDADGLVRASGYTVTPTCSPGEPFRLTVPSPLAA